MRLPLYRLAINQITGLYNEGERKRQIKMMAANLK
jgi:hypothetical protein